MSLDKLKLNTFYFKINLYSLQQFHKGDSANERYDFISGLDTFYTDIESGEVICASDKIISNEVQLSKKLELKVKEKDIPNCWIYIPVADYYYCFVGSFPACFLVYKKIKKRLFSKDKESIVASGIFNYSNPNHIHNTKNLSNIQIFKKYF